MDIDKVLEIEDEIRRVIELSLDNRVLSESEQDEEIYGAEEEPLVENNPFLGADGGFEESNTLAGYLERMTAEELKIVLTLMFTGKEIAEENVEDENLEETADIFARYYASVPEEKGTIIDYILEETANLEKYLTNGLMYSM